MNKNKKTVSVVVGRFQTPYLHEGHRFLLDSASESGNEMLICLGVSNGAPDFNHPMDFETRKVMISSQYPNARIIPVSDNRCDVAWSAKLDSTIESLYPNHEITLFGSRDSFIPHYKGRNKTYELPKIESKSGTYIREQVCKDIPDSIEFRRGVIHLCTNQLYPTSFQSVDVVIEHSMEPKVIVGRKLNEDGWRFPGGFVDPSDLSLECAARREVTEEVGNIEISDITYLNSLRMDKDCRYRKSNHKIMTALFKAKYIFGIIQANDDLAEVRWQQLDGLVQCLVDEHKPLGELYLKSINNQ